MNPVVSNISDSDFEKQVHSFIEIIIKKADKIEFFIIHEFLKDELKNYSSGLGFQLIERTKKTLNYYGYTIDDGHDFYYQLTSLGIEVKKLGGHAKYVEFLDAKEKASEAKAKAEYENLIHSTKVNKYLYKTRWLPHFLALGALAVSIWALVESKNESKPGFELNVNKAKEIGTVKNNTITDTIIK